MASQKLGFLKKLTPEMVLAETKKRTGGAAAAARRAAAAGGVPADYVPTTDDVFAVIEEYLEAEPRARAEGRRRSTCWKLGDRQRVDCSTSRTASGSVTAGRRRGRLHARAHRRGLPRLTQGKADAMKLFTAAS